jgi:SAM-dependent methyltransferase
MEFDQKLENKKAEVRFRRVLSEQETTGELIEPHVFSSSEIIEVLRAGVEETSDVFEDLQTQGIEFSPFLEIGAERGHRSFFLVNHYEAQGFALDLSLDALQFGDHLVSAFDFTDAPVRICGDAVNLPFKSNLLPFVFCFATLHHFPDPMTVVEEGVRVLKDEGHFFFDREPTRGKAAITLWMRYGHKLTTVENLLAKLGILGFISEGGGIEREYGILENTFPLKTWLEIASIFEAGQMQVNQSLKIRFDPYRSSMARKLARFFGGVTRFLGTVSKEEPSVKITNWLEMLRCPTCRLDDPALNLRWLPDRQGLTCPRCRTTYPEHNGVYLLLTEALQQDLYSNWQPISQVQGQSQPKVKWVA